MRLGNNTDTGREEGRSGVVIDGDEGTKVAGDKLYIMRKRLKALFKNPARKAVFRPRRGIPWVLAGGKKDQSPLHARKGQDTHQKPHTPPTEPTGISLHSQTLQAPPHPPSSARTHNRPSSPACHCVPKTSVLKVVSVGCVPAVVQQPSLVPFPKGCVKPFRSD